MTSTEILAMPAEEVYRRVEEALWPWDDAYCKVCGNRLDEEPICTPDKCNVFFDAKEEWWEHPPINLQSWQGVGRVVEAMRERGWRFEVIGKANGFYYAEFRSIVSHFENATAQTPWEAVARACLLALAESEAAK